MLSRSIRFVAEGKQPAAARQLEGLVRFEEDAVTAAGGHPQPGSEVVTSGRRYSASYEPLQRVPMLRVLRPFGASARQPSHWLAEPKLTLRR